MSDSLLVGIVDKNSQDQLRVTLQNFKGHDLLDLRVFSRFSAANVPMPTKAGVSINVERLPELIAVLQAAAGKARELGLIGGGA